MKHFARAVLSILFLTTGALASVKLPMECPIKAGEEKSALEYLNNNIDASIFTLTRQG